MGNSQGQESVGTTDDSDETVTRGGSLSDQNTPPSTVLSPRAKGGLSTCGDFHVHVKIEKQLYTIRVPNAYTTTGWLLREATQRYLADNGDPGVVALQRSDDTMADLSAHVIGYLSKDETLEAVRHTDGNWAPENCSVSRNTDEVGYHPGEFEDQSQLTDFEVNVLVGDGSEYTMLLPSMEMTIGWILSETIRRYMCEHDDQDPGILGLRMLRGIDLDLSDEAAEVLESGDTLEATSYTIKRVKLTKAQRQKEQAIRDKKRMQARIQGGGTGSPLRPGSPRRSGSRGGMMELDENGVPILDPSSSPIADSPRLSSGGLFSGSRSKSRGSNADRNSDSLIRQRSGSGRFFMPLRELVQSIEAAEARESEDRRLRRHSADRPTSVLTFSVECTADPTGGLGRYVDLHIDSVRLAVVDREGGDPLISWRYEEIQGWVVAENAFSVKRVQEWGIELFVFETNESSAISNAMLQRVSNLIATRKHQKRQRLLQKQRELALSLNEGDTEEEESWQEFFVERLIDPSGILMKHLVLRFGTSEMQVVDASAKDVLFSWPYIMCYAWGVTDNTFVAAISVVAPTGASKRVSSDKHYHTYAFRTDHDQEIQDIVRNVMDRIRENDTPDTEVRLPETMNESRVRNAIAEEWNASKHAGGTVLQSTQGNESVFCFEGENDDDELVDFMAWNDAVNNV